MRKEGILGGGRVVKKPCDIEHTKEKKTWIWQDRKSIQVVYICKESSSNSGRRP